MEGKPNQLYAQGMRSFEQYDELCKYFAEGKQRDNDANDIQKHLQHYDLKLGEYLVKNLYEFHRLKLAWSRPDSGLVSPF